MREKTKRKQPGKQYRMQTVPVFWAFKFILLFTFLVLISLTKNIAYAAVRDITPADVTTAAASVIWVSDEAVISATVRVFSDPDGLNEITSQLTLTTVSEQFPPAHTQGIVKVDITGLSPDTFYYIQTETTSASGLTIDPVANPFIEINTAVETTRSNASNLPIVNDLIRNQMFMLDGVTPAPGTIVLLQAENLSAYPISAIVGENGYAAPLAVLDMNNFYGADGLTAEILADQVLLFSEYRGLLCSADLDNHIVGFKRRAPAHVESPAITELENPTDCYFANLDCNNVVNVGDFQTMLNVFNTAQGQCLYNRNFDLNSDGAIDVGDFQAILNQFGNTSPF